MAYIEDKSKIIGMLANQVEFSVSADKHAKSQESDHPGLQEELEQARQRLLDLERELQFIKLEQDENKALLNAARHDLNLNNKQAEEQKEKEVRTRFRMLFQELSGRLRNCWRKITC